jgi:hypothetical protein
VVDKLLLLTILQGCVEVGTRVYAAPSRCGICSLSGISRNGSVSSSRIGCRMISQLRLLFVAVVVSDGRKLMHNIVSAIHLKSATGGLEVVVYSVDTACRVGLAFVSVASLRRPMTSPMMNLVTYLQMVQRGPDSCECSCVTTSC